MNFIHKNSTPRYIAASSSTFDFTKAGSTRIPGVRRNRNKDKVEAKEMDKIVNGLTYMNKGQIKAVAHLLTPEIVEELAIAARLPRSNQGRKRQEGLVAKRMRQYVDDASLEKLAAAVQLAESQNVYVDTDIAVLVETWRERLLEAETAAFQEVLKKAEEACVDLTAQRLAQLVRSYQLCLRQGEESTSGTSISDSAEDVFSRHANEDRSVGGTAQHGGDASDRPVNASEEVLTSRSLQASRTMALASLRPAEAQFTEAGRRRAQQLALNALEKALQPIAEYQVLNNS
ncbi:hypothetical protein CEUSTIGMA_g5087.t1 [Chlamydomonas eustigma]|uniref:Uncharacterized protein n=1 Tax=Chlamydomonas eustigma TaxID=1157962 RepID=A0A250X3J0_9CHLO|nr:hypothetical protein CEUSTIGMA_g5087.t1 [Chlamydomonas eustigma]|eukprot:GAX77644.1 hypothetical protein CEUSTIGMA_g5087.t1 [Chlamydomonas eustigma]